MVHLCPGVGTGEGIGIVGIDRCVSSRFALSILCLNFEKRPQVRVKNSMVGLFYIFRYKHVTTALLIEKFER